MNVTWPLEEDITNEMLGERFNIREIAFDRWGVVQMVQNLEGMGFTVAIRTGFQRYVTADKGAYETDA